MSVEQKQLGADEVPVDRIEDGQPDKLGDQLMTIADDVIDSHPSGTSMYMMRLYAILSVGYFCIILQGYDSSLMGAINAVPEYLAYFGM